MDSYIKQYNIRIPNLLLSRMKEKARANGVSTTQLVISAIREYMKEESK